MMGDKQAVKTIDSYKNEVKALTFIHNIKKRSFRVQQTAIRIPKERNGSQAERPGSFKPRSQSIKAT
jgi:hypothetical protein